MATAIATGKLVTIIILLLSHDGSYKGSTTIQTAAHHVMQHSNIDQYVLLLWQGTMGATYPQNVK